MGLLNKLQNEGSNFSGFDGADIPLSAESLTKQSKLHQSYSITGNPSLTDMIFQSTLPPPSATLDLNGNIPTFAGHGVTTTSVSSQQLPYIQNQPEFPTGISGITDGN